MNVSGLLLNPDKNLSAKWETNFKLPAYHSQTLEKVVETENTLRIHPYLIRHEADISLLLQSTVTGELVYSKFRWFQANGLWHTEILRTSRQTDLPLLRKKKNSNKTWLSYFITKILKIEKCHLSH